jgi:hypothetical protein
MKVKRDIKNSNAFRAFFPVVPLYMSTCAGKIQSTCNFIAKSMISISLRQNS